MNAPERVNDWTAANQQLLVAEFARLRALLGEPGEGGNAALASARTALPAPAAIDTLAALFQLSPFERELVLLAAGVEMDARLAALCAQAGTAQRPWASFGLALAALPDPHWSALAPDAPLRHWRLLEIDEGAGLTSARLRIAERVLHYLAGLDHLDYRLQSLLRPVSDDAPHLAGDRVPMPSPAPGSSRSTRAPPAVAAGAGPAPGRAAAARRAGRPGQSVPPGRAPHCRDCRRGACRGPGRRHGHAVPRGA